MSLSNSNKQSAKESLVKKLSLLKREMSLGRNELGIQGSSGSSCPNTPHVRKAYRLVIVGSSKCGKTSLVNRFLNGEFPDFHIPTIENFHRKFYKIHNEYYQLDIFDTAGNDPFPAARRLQILTGDMFLIVFAVDNQGSCNEALRLLDEVIDIKSDCSADSPPEKFAFSRASIKKSNFNNNTKLQNSTPILIVANMTDLPKSKWTIEDISTVKNTVLKRACCDMIQCSAKEDENVYDAFHRLFVLAKLPKQMSPCYHRSITLERSLDSAVSQGSPLQRKSTVSRRIMSKFNDAPPTVVFDAEAKRPSLRTDLLSLNLKLRIVAPSSAARHPPTSQQQQACAKNDGKSNFSKNRVEKRNGDGFKNGGMGRENEPNSSKCVIF